MEKLKSGINQGIAMIIVFMIVGGLEYAILNVEYLNAIKPAAFYGLLSIVGIFALLIHMTGKQAHPSREPSGVAKGIAFASLIQGIPNALLKADYEPVSNFWFALALGIVVLMGHFVAVSMEKAEQEDTQEHPQER